MPAEKIRESSSISNLLPMPVATAWHDPFPKEPLGCSCYRSGKIHLALGELLTLTPGRGSKSCHWQLATLPTSETQTLDEAACLVADGTMRWRCRGSINTYTAWRDAINSGVSLDAKTRQRVIPFVKTLFGEPGSPSLDVHLRGWIAEFIWFRLSSELNSADGRDLVLLEGPSFLVTEPGGDGLAVWRQAVMSGSRLRCSAMWIPGKLSAPTPTT
jgi:hypothetical protein